MDNKGKGKETGEITIPGKILFFGGISILEKGNPGLSIAVLDKENRGVTAKYSVGDRRIISPQFGIDSEPSFENKQLIAYSYLATETYLKSKGKWKNDVIVEVRNSKIFGEKDEKTGLGSSAAATVAVVKALFLANGLDADKEIEAIHKLAQFSYAMFSQKVGSGFDIATSTYARTIIYRRYDPKAIALPKTTANSDLAKSVVSSVDKLWAWLEIKPFSIPRKYDVLFFNINGAKTSTIGSVKAIMQFKEKSPKKYAELIRMQKNAEENAIVALSKADDSAAIKYTHAAREAHRMLQKETLSIVPDFDPVEPKPLTRVIDESEKIGGVVAGRCPGAGGWDGVAFLVHKEFSDAGKIIDIGKKEGLKLEHVSLKVL